MTAARRVAAEAAARAGVTIRPLTTMDEFVALDALFTTVWGPRGGGAILPSELTRALEHSGNYVVGAYDGDRMVGGSAGFLGRHRGRDHLHSHITGVLPDLQARAIGYALKLHQRSWALDAGLDEVIWTFDPLIRRNAYFNLSKLGARVIGYETRFYGEAMTDAINAGDETDRAVVTWRVASPEVESIITAPTPPPAPAAATILLDRDDTGRPVFGEPPAGHVLAAWIPSDIVATRRTDPELALQWRHALRDTVGRAITDGYEATSMSRDGWYTLRREKQ
jgi:predicted GNAT superfamily acetyltransferase